MYCIKDFLTDIAYILFYSMGYIYGEITKYKNKYK